jgi:hypothetical protein
MHREGDGILRILSNDGSNLTILIPSGESQPGATGLELFWSLNRGDTRVFKILMRPPDNNIAEARLTVLDSELSGYDTDPCASQDRETTRRSPYPDESQRFHITGFDDFQE